MLAIEMKERRKCAEFRINQPLMVAEKLENKLRVVIKHILVAV